MVGKHSIFKGDCQLTYPAGRNWEYGSWQGFRFIDRIAWAHFFWELISLL